MNYNATGMRQFIRGELRNSGKHDDRLFSLPFSYHLYSRTKYSICKLRVKNSINLIYLDNCLSGRMSKNESVGCKRILY